MPVDILFDIENDGFLDDTKRVHCICGIYRDASADVPFEYGPSEIDKALDTLASADRVIGHNILRHDLPVLRKLHGFQLRPNVVIRDTKVIARLKHPDVNDTDAALILEGTMPAGKAYRGKHSIAAWGFRLGIPKLHEDITDWSVHTPEMQERCAGDVKTNMALWDHLLRGLPPDDAIELEQDIDVLVWLMERSGVPFDVPAAGALHVELMEAKERLEKALVSQFGSWLAPDGPNGGVRVSKVNRTLRLPDGTTRLISKGEQYVKQKLVTFNPQSRQHIEKVLRERGWEPTEFTPSGQAKIDEAVIDALTKRFPEISGLGQLMLVNKRLSQLVEGDSALLRSVGPDGCIHGVINPMGTQTSRASHFKPNLAQVPANKSPYGERFRALFRMLKYGWVLVGADQEGLEGRGLAHFLAAFDGGAYAEILLRGDPHWASTKALGFVGPDEARDKHNPFHVIVREGSKTFYYAFIYGAGDKKLGQIIYDICLSAEAAGFPEPIHRVFPRGIGKDTLRRVGSRAREKFEKGIKGLDRLVEKAQSHVEKWGWVPGLDGRRIPARAKHSAVNYLIQSSGAIICKRWGVDAYKELIRRGYKFGWDGDFVFVLWVHDEYQVACKTEIAHEVGEVLVACAKKAGEPYGFRVPLDSKYDIGRSWAETH